jgi:glycosyltransferase involved in cell wall biosynthesis
VTALRVAYVLGTTQGGTGRHVAMLARGCAAEGIGVAVFGPGETRSLLGLDPVPRQEPARLDFGAVNIGDRPRPGRDAAAVRRLRLLLTGFAPDVVHAHGLRAGAAAALALRPYPAARWAGGRRPALVVTVHNAPPPSAPAAVIYGLLERLVARRADVVLCVSADLTSRMRRLGAREVAAAIVPAPEPDRLSAGADAGPRPADDTRPRPAAITADGRPVVLAVGRLAAQKGFDTLIAAAARWRGRRPEPQLVIAGTGPLAGRLSDQAAELGVDVRFLGSRDDVASLLAAADVLALPSRWEGQPLILSEALRAGRPVVATDVGGVRDLAGDGAALLVPPGDPAAFAAAVLSVLDDRDLAASLSAAAAARAATLPGEADAIAAVIALYSRLGTADRDHRGFYG